MLERTVAPPSLPVEQVKDKSTIDKPSSARSQGNIEYSRSSQVSLTFTTQDPSEYPQVVSYTGEMPHQTITYVSNDPQNIELNENRASLQTIVNTTTVMYGQSNPPIFLQEPTPPPYVSPPNLFAPMPGETIVDMEGLKKKNDNKGLTMKDFEKSQLSDVGSLTPFKEENEDNQGSEDKKKKKKKKDEDKPRIWERMLDKFIDWFDGFGESVDGPGLRHKTFMGALATTVMRIACLVLIAYKLYVLIKDDSNRIHCDSQLRQDFKYKIHGRSHVAAHHDQQYYILRKPNIWAITSKN